MFDSIYITQLLVLDQEEALEFYVGKLGLEVKTDMDLGFMRWLTVAVPGRPDREILLEVPGAPAMDEATAEQARALVTKGAAGGWIGFTTSDIHTTFDRLVAAGVEVTQEPIERFYGIDCGVRDPFGNAIRILQPAVPAAEEA